MEEGEGRKVEGKVEGKKKSRASERKREKREGREGVGAGRVAQRMAIVGGWDGPRGLVAKGRRGGERVSRYSIG